MAYVWQSTPWAQLGRTFPHNSQATFRTILRLQQLGYPKKNRAKRKGREIKPSLSKRRTRRVFSYIESNMSKPIHLNDLANAAALSPFHFSRLFKALTGLPPMRYVWERRVEAAKHMLATSNAKISAVAYECGFSSQSHFTTKFKLVTGKTPAEYRRTVKAQTLFIIFDIQ